MSELTNEQTATIGAIHRPHQGLDAIRIQAEIETADRSQTKRPTWAPAVVLNGELLELCREVEHLSCDDKPVARLWAVFADPRRKGTVIRTAYSKHVLADVRCRGFEMRAGTRHDGGRMTDALMDSDGTWSIGHVRWGHSNIHDMRRWINKYQNRIREIHRALKPRPAPTGATPEERCQWVIKQGGSEEQAQRILEFERKYQAEDLARWEKQEQQKRDPAFIEAWRKREAQIVARLEQLEKDVAIELLAQACAAADLAERLQEEVERDGAVVRTWADRSVPTMSTMSCLRFSAMRKCSLTLKWAAYIPLKWCHRL